MRKQAFKTPHGLLTRCAALLLTATAWPSLSAGAGGLVPQHSEDLRPALKRAPDGNTATLELGAAGRDFRLQLSNNQRLAHLAAGSSMQLYKGAIEGVPGSWARITIQDGLPRGMIWDGRELYIVDAPPEGVNYGAAGTVMFKLSDAVLEHGVSLGDDAVEKPRDAAAAYGALIEELRAIPPALQAAAATQRVEVSILGDSAYVARFANEAAARDAILTRINNVDGIFSAQVGVELQVVSVSLAGEVPAGLSDSTSSSTLLESLAQLRQNSPSLSATGLTHLFTGRQLDGNSAGIAYLEAVCSRRFGASLTMALSNVTIDSLVTAHEIGHLFGAPHDGADECAATPQNQFIMTPTLTTAVSSFSQCSLDQINAVIDSYSCLVDIPPTAPTPTPPAPTPPSPPPSDGDGGGGGGSLEPLLLLLLLALMAAGVHRRADRRTRR